MQLLRTSKLVTRHVWFAGGILSLTMVDTFVPVHCILHNGASAIICLISCTHMCHVCGATGYR